jgi:hypothetical protein
MDSSDSASDTGGESDSSSGISASSRSGSSRSISSPFLSSYFSDDDDGGGGGGGDENVHDAGHACARDVNALVERQLEASIFQVEPVTHIAYQLLYVDDERALERVECHVMRLRAPNVIDRFDIGRIIKAARYDRGCSGGGAGSGGTSCQLYRLESLFVYNVDVAFDELGSLLLAPEFPVARFITVLSSVSNFVLKPTMACFHSANSVHVVLSRTRGDPVLPPPGPGPGPGPGPAPALKRHIVITPAAFTRRRRPTHS